MLLHTINKSPWDKNTFDTCLAYAKKGSGILLLEDGIYAALKGTSAESKVTDAIGSSINMYVLGPDLNARGMTEENVIDGVKVVDYAGFVDLTTEHDTVQSWL